MSTVLDPQRQEQQAPVDDMVHVASTCCPPYAETLCGRPILPDDLQVTPEVPTDCMVCYEIDQVQRQCPRCGNPLVPR